VGHKATVGSEKLNVAGVQRVDEVAPKLGDLQGAVELLSKPGFDLIPQACPADVSAREAEKDGGADDERIHQHLHRAQENPGYAASRSGHSGWLVVQRS
jgi:hypothetical protein